MQPSLALAAAELPRRPVNIAGGDKMRIECAAKHAGDNGKASRSRSMCARARMGRRRARMGRRARLGRARLVEAVLGPAEDAGQHLPETRESEARTPSKVSAQRAWRPSAAGPCTAFALHALSALDSSAPTP
eukprot:1831901-Pleurochrysis_carterae.AAC.1